MNNNLFDALNFAYLSSMYTLWQVEGSSWFDVAMSHELSDLFDESLKVKGSWEITNSNDDVVLSGTN